jgi:hypothetical protein
LTELSKASSSAHSRGRAPGRFYGTQRLFVAIVAAGFNSRQFAAAHSFPCLRKKWISSRKNKRKYFSPAVDSLFAPEKKIRAVHSPSIRHNGLREDYRSPREIFLARIQPRVLQVKDLFC